MAKRVAVCTPCIGSELREAILKRNPDLKPLLKKIADCDEPLLMDFCLDSSRGRGKRAPSKYNIFVGSCMKQGKPLKQCAADWKQRKGA
jgi:hypothetical protein